MKKLVVTFALFLSVVLPTGGEGKNSVDPGMCSLIPNYANSQAPFARKGVFSKAFKQVRRGKLQRAHQQFNKRHSTLEAEAKRLFQEAGGKEVTNGEIQSFLEKYVLGPRPALVTSFNDFHILPEVALTWTHVQCVLGHNAADWKGLISLHGGSHPDGFQVRALVAFSAGDMTAMETLIKARDGYGERDVMRWVIGGLWHAASGRTVEAQSAHARAASSCMSPRECEWSHWLGRYLNESRHEKQP